MDLSSYAELAVRLVNTSSLGHEGGDLLTSMDGLRALVSDREHLNHGMTRAGSADRWALTLYVNSASPNSITLSPSASR